MQRRLLLVFFEFIVQVKSFEDNQIWKSIALTTESRLLTLTDVLTCQVTAQVMTNY